MIIAGTPYYIREEPGKWTALDPKSPRSLSFNASSLDGNTLVYALTGNWIYRVDPAASETGAYAGAEGASWDPVPEMRKYGQYLAPGVVAGLAPGGYISVDVPANASGRYELRWFRPGSPREGEKMTLLLKSPDAPKTAPFVPLFR